MCRGCERVRSSSSRIGERKDSPDPHERQAILLAEALRSHGNILAFPSSAEGLRTAPEIRDVRRTTCCVVGGGPGGTVLSLLLARAGVDVTLLEAHPDFDRE